MRSALPTPSTERNAAAVKRAVELCRHLEASWSFDDGAALTDGARAAYIQLLKLYAENPYEGGDRQANVLALIDRSEASVDQVCAAQDALSQAEKVERDTYQALRQVFDGPSPKGRPKKTRKARR